MHARTGDIMTGQTPGLLPKSGHQKLSASYISTDVYCALLYMHTSHTVNKLFTTLGTQKRIML